MKNKYQTILKRLEEHKAIIKSLGYDVVYIALQGSQNYRLDNKDSDIDSKAIVVPNLELIALKGTEISFTHHLENGEQIDVKDVKTMFNQFKKMNPSYLEILFTDYYIFDNYYATELCELRALATDIVNCNPSRLAGAIKGTAFQKHKMLVRETPKTKEDIEKYGYSAKDAHHLARMLCFTQCLLKEKTLNKKVYKATNYGFKNIENLLKLKQHDIDKNRVLVEAEVWLAKIVKLCDEEVINLTANMTDIDFVLGTILTHIFKKGMKREVLDLIKKGDL